MEPPTELSCTAHTIAITIRRAKKIHVAEFPKILNEFLKI